MSASRVVIVGGGFGGLHAARALGRSGYDVTLVDKRNFQLFQPLLYQVATGAIPPGDIAIPQRVVLRKLANVRCLHATAYDVDPARRVLFHEHGELPYDFLIVATGVKHSYFGHDDWAPHAPGLKTVEHAIEIRHRIFRAFELAEACDDPAERAELMTFVVVGAGPTGVEVAGALGELAQRTMVGDFRAIDPRDARIVLVEGAPDVLPVYPSKLRARAREQLEALGVAVRTGCVVEAITAEVVRWRAGDKTEELRTRTVLWAAGVRISAFGAILAQRVGVATEKGGRIAVDKHCRLASHPEIFVIGDLARLTDAKGREVPGLAQAAIQQGRHVAKVLRAKAAGRSGPAAFRYRDLGTMAVIGMNRAVGVVFGRQLSGIVAWFMWAFVHVMALVSAEQRVRVFVQWAWKYFTRREGDRLITG
ncbi:MAG TPA: NAD(P)/FAD-dependent oxidoreductase, partial [Verrucomicrobiae bacterium]|nr:NAD(P)/FAD-dependent oxidoreductase [Verrucomicrobiae bacterium]